jgi:lipid-binding SYLF domain-containing protein
MGRMLDLIPETKGGKFVTKINRELYDRDATNREILAGDFKTPAVAATFEHALNRDSDSRTS